MVDDRPEPDGLPLPACHTPIEVAHSGGRSPAAARNTGWHRAHDEWIAFLDDDVVVGHDGATRLAEDLDGLPPASRIACVRIVRSSRPRADRPLAKPVPGRGPCPPGIP